jgi:hypothetical protein
MKLPAALVLLAALIFALPVFAHISETAGSITGTLHIEPADSPGVGDNSYLHFSFEDTEKKIDLLNCNCAISLSDGSTTLVSNVPFTGPDFFVKKDAVTMTYIFPHKGIYTITIMGAPTEAASFKPFTFSYDIRVDRDNGGRISLWQRFSSSHLFHTEHSGHAIIILLALIVGGILTVYTVRKEKRANQQLKK